jgi:hypothetical protein
MDTNAKSCIFWCERIYEYRVVVAVPLRAYGITLELVREERFCASVG